MDINSFKDAFDTHRGSCRGDCPCGRIFYNSDGEWNFEPGELEKLEADPKATDLDCSIGFVRFEGDEWVWQCDCWHKRAEMIMDFIDSHSYQIAQYLTLKKKRMTEKAGAMPVVKGGL